MKLTILLFALITYGSLSHSQDLDSLYKKGQYDRIVELYKSSGHSFSDQQLPIAAAAYDRLGKLDDEEKVLELMIRTYDPMITSDIPANYPYYTNLIKAGRMDKFRNAITEQYVMSVRDTALGRRLINTLFDDQAPRQKYQDIKYSKDKGLLVRWDEKSVLKEWPVVDSSTSLSYRTHSHSYQDPSYMPHQLKPDHTDPVFGCLSVASK